MEENVEKINEISPLIQSVLDKLDNKDFGFYFFTLDTKGNPSAGIANIYEHVKILIELGYKAYILHEKNDYHGVGEWLGEDYAKLPHVSIEAQKLNVGPADFVIIPEVFANVMDQTKNFPCKRIVFSQSYEYIFELLNFGTSWNQYGITDVITTSEKQATYIKSLFPYSTTYVVPVSIPSYFKPYDKPQKPIISVVGRNQKDILKLIKSFYIQYPNYKWVTFKELRGLGRKDFADLLKESCLAVWIDEISGFGTFPLEAIECDVTVMGKIPTMIPEWMEEEKLEDGSVNLKNNGVWTNNTLEFPNLIAQFLKVWLEDSVPEGLVSSAKACKGAYTEEKQKSTIDKIYQELVEKRKLEIKAKV